MAGTIMEGGWFSGKKTYIAAFVGVVGVVAGYLTGDLGLTTALAGGWVAVQSIFLRMGISNSSNN